MGKLMIIEMAKLVVLTMLMMTPYQSKCLQAADEPKPAWAETMATHGEQRKTVLQFYYHDTVSGENVTAVQVVAAPGSNQTLSGFGFIAMFDDPLTVGHHPKSKLVGRAQGFYGSDSRQDMSMLMTFTCTFSDGIYNGSSLSILGRDSILDPVREFPVIGGTGLFRMARGYALAQTYFFNITSGNAIVGFNVTLFHH